ncbi:MAG: extracellular solute-binding protein [Clostridia bacterium]|nr:extracellular solute-binding protein [Clostridia bacterium]MBR6579533.1 extracellular solute-binding protein [Clostridia bacterium]
MKKRIISLLLVLSMIFSAAAMVSCNGGEGAGEGNTGKVAYEVPAEGYDGSAVTITFYHSMGQKLQDVLNTYIPEFNKLYPNITVEHSSMGNYDGVRDQIKTALTAGNQPNIAYCYPDHVALYNVAKAVVPLDSFIESTIPVTDATGAESVLGFTAEQIADFIPGYYQEGAAFDEAGTMYTLPMSKSTEALYYNKTFFEKNGLSLPTTWEEMGKLCEQIKAIDPDCVPLGYDSEANWFITMCEQYGSDYTSLNEDEHFLFDNETNRGFVKTFREWYQKGYVTTEEIYGSYTSGLFTATEGQKCYMVIGSTGGASYQQPPQVDGNPLFETAMATPPQVNPAAPKVISQGPSVCIFKDTNPQEVVASWLFVKFLTTNVEFQASFSMASGYAPVIKSVQSNPVYQQWLDAANGYTNLTAMSVKLALAQSDAYFVSPAFNGSSEARDQVGTLMQDALVSTDADIDATIKKLFEKAVAECEYAAD